MKFQRYLGGDPMPPGVHINPELSASSPEKKNPHIDVARGVLFVQVNDVIIYADNGDPLAVLTAPQFDAMINEGLELADEATPLNNQDEINRAMIEDGRRG